MEAETYYQLWQQEKYGNVLPLEEEQDEMERMQLESLAQTNVISSYINQK